MLSINSPDRLGMNYDSWKTGGGVDPHYEALVDRCADIEANLDNKLKVVVDEVNRVSEYHWEFEPVLADPDDAGISLELAVRLGSVPVSGAPSDLQELAQAFLKMSESLSQAARDLAHDGVQTY